MNMKEKYDVIVIGAGIGGLTCAAFLAKEELSVLVAEQHSKPGGYCTSFQRKGFTFDVGIDFVMGVESGGVFSKILEELGIKDEGKFITLSPLTRVIGADYNIPSTPFEDLADELKKMFPSENVAIDTFLEECKSVNSQSMAFGELSLDLLSFGGKMKMMIDFMSKAPKVRKYGSKSYQQVLSELFKEPELRAILGSLPDHNPRWAANVQMRVLGFPAFHYPKGGAQALADVFAEGVTRHGGELLLKTMVTRIILENGKAIGVELADGRRVSSSYVVSNADGTQTFLKLVGEQHLNQKFVKELKETQLSAPFFLVSLGVNMDLNALGFDGTSIVYNRSGNIDDIYNGDPDISTLWIMMHSLREPSQAPEGMATVQIATLFPYNYMGYWKREADGTRGKEYVELKETLADKLISSVERIIPELSNHIICKDIATPLTFERYTLNREGAGHGWFPTPRAKMRSQKTPIKNLYQAGHWTFPGFGIFTVALSGRHAARLVLKDLKRS
jgi:all-trans-retinol 13,14-reductase